VTNARPKIVQLLTCVRSVKNGWSQICFDYYDDDKTNFFKKLIRKKSRK
jgi:hypothetical protein